ncbi:hypothetical protein PVNG_02364 [Plasmodium vivax North Korean]|uniref:Uncharacterized protein n=1 Tax=Plasmodium vivax North Korean TaxID=1035514 RepID=A0A0J9TM38_PLAVI|nr:hypothetical protein PVNG_02364 [Plasmodium vivax North Korean]
MELIDIAGIVPLDGELEGKKSHLGPSFLSHIRGVKVILIVVRAFSNCSSESHISRFLEDHPETKDLITMLESLDSFSLDKDEKYKTKELSSRLNHSRIRDPKSFDSSLLVNFEGKQKLLNKFDTHVTDDVVFEAQLVLATLIRSDLELLGKAIGKLKKDFKVNEKELNFLIPLLRELDEKKIVPIIHLKTYQESSELEKNILDRLSLLTSKRIVILCNYGHSEESLGKLGILKK